MDSGKYIDMAVQNPHGKEMVRLIFLPDNLKRLSHEMERFIVQYNYRTLGKKMNMNMNMNMGKSVSAEEYGLKVLYGMIWAYGVLRLPQSNKTYWWKHPLTSTRSPWGEVPMEIYIVDHFLDDVIRPQCPW